MDKQSILIIAAGIVVLIILAVIVILASLKKPVYKKKGQLLLLNEQKLLTALLQALPANILLTFKVRLLDIVGATNANNGKSLNHELADYCVDFVLVDRETTAVRLCIEMDSESTNATDRLNKNTIISRALRRAGVAHLRLPLVRFYDPARLRQIIGEMLKPPTK